MPQEIVKVLRRNLFVLRAMRSGAYSQSEKESLNSMLAQTIEQIHQLHPQDLIAAYSHSFIYNLTYLEIKQRELDSAVSSGFSIPELIVIHETLISTIEATLTRYAPRHI